MPGLPVIVVITCITSFVSAGDIQVNIDLGTIIGKQNTYGQIAIYEFLGVPYAKPPIGDLRFADPQPITKPFKGGKLVCIKSKKCWQHLPHNNVVVGEEDCLTLNIYTPSLDEKSNYPVLVFIHGGGFFYGMGHSYSPQYLFSINKEIVFVSINYRLGLFGFLTTADRVVPGNMGLKDQVMALRWIKKYIKAFGGNPQDVTLAGMSAGGISVHLHYLSPMSRDLFDRGISMSGVALSPLLKTKNTRRGAERLAELMDCPKRPSSKMVKCLREKDPKEMTEKITKDPVPYEDFRDFSHFGPVVEKSGMNPFIDEHPYFLLKEGKIKHAPWLASATTAEGVKPGATFMSLEDKVAKLNSDWNNIAPYMLIFEDSVLIEQYPDISQRIKEHYFKNKNEVITTELPIRDKVIKIIGDRLYLNSIENAIRLHAHVSKKPVYMYMFSYDGEHSFSKVLTRTNSAAFGAGHVDDLLYILKFGKFNPLQNPQDGDVVKKMVRMWSHYILYDIPLADDGFKWPKVPKNIVYEGDLPYVEIDGEAHKKTSSDLSERKFWESLPLDDLHVSGDRKVPKHIKALQMSIFGSMLQPYKRLYSEIIQERTYPTTFIGRLLNRLRFRD